MRELLDAVGGCPDAVRLAVVVLAARTPAASGRVEMRTGELARWLGVSASYAASVVLPRLRRAGVVRAETLTGEFGEDRGLVFEVVPLWRARGVVGHPLALRRTELATLLRLLEAVMAPGWRHRNGSTTPAGLLGARTGRGAATDRLAALLLVLEAGPSGWVRLCGGAVDKRGRLAATVARLLGCGSAGGERVLQRLEAAGAVQRCRRQTASGLYHRSRLVVPAVAAAHDPEGRRRLAGSGQGRPRGEGVRAPVVEPDLEFSDPDAAAQPGDEPVPETNTEVKTVLVPVETDKADPDVAADLHASHPPVAEKSDVGCDKGGFSGAADHGESDLPDRARAHEDRAPVDDESGSRPGPHGVDDAARPLRGEQPEESLTTDNPDTRQEAGEPSLDDGDVADLRNAASPAPDCWLPGWVPGPPGDVACVLEPVAALWARVERAGARRVVVRAVRRQLRVVAGVTGVQGAERVLADRLRCRLAEQPGGPAAVADPVGWLLGRGLKRRGACEDLRCDDGWRMDTGAGCGGCRVRVEDRRLRRQLLAAELEVAHPDADPEARQVLLETRLHQQVLDEAEELAARRRQAQERAAAALAAAAAEQARPCADCAEPAAAGLCASCRHHRTAAKVLEQAAVLAAAVGADLADRAEVEVVLERAKAALRAELEEELAATRAKGAVPLIVGLQAKLVAQTAAARHRRAALEQLAGSQQAQDAARQAYDAALGERPDEVDAAVQAADAARQRAARQLLNARTDRVRGRTDPYVAGAAQARAAMRTARDAVLRERRVACAS